MSDTTKAPSMTVLRVVKSKRHPFDSTPEICKTRVKSCFHDRNGVPIYNGDAVRYWCSGRKYMGEYRATKHRDFSECESRVVVFKNKRKHSPRVYCDVGFGMIGSCPLSFVACCR